jgi:hypothetical protein
MAIMMIVMIGILSTISYAYTASTRTEQLDIARRIASYTVEYLRARTVTRTNNLVGAGTVSGVGVYFFNGTNALNGAFPSIIDAWGLPLQSNGKDCRYSQAYVASHSSIVDGSLNGDGVTRMQFSSRNPALPTQTAADVPWAFSSTLQGYSSLLDPSGSSSWSAQNPCAEDGNLARTSGSGNNTGYYQSSATGCHVPVLFPGTYGSATAVAQFQALSGYVPRIYATDTRYTTTSSLLYDPHYTNAVTGTMAYRGFRVLTQIVARKATSAQTQVQYYDVQVTVFWVTGTKESHYGLATQIVAY